MICPVCERDNGELVEDRNVGGGTSSMCRPCQRVCDIVEEAPLEMYGTRLGEDVHGWARRMQDEILDEATA